VTSSAALLIGARCKICSRTRSYGEVRGSEAEGFTCVRCLEWHNHALAVLAGAIPRGCQECPGELREGVKMVLVPKDGIYQVLCKSCEARYAPRSGFYRGTLYEKLKKMAGYK